MEHIEKYKKADYKIIATGHSLGGAVSEHVTIELEHLIDHCESFNAGTSPLPNKRSKVTTIFLGGKRVSN